MNNAQDTPIRSWRPHSAGQAVATIAGIVFCIVFFQLTGLVYGWVFVNPGLLANSEAVGSTILGWLLTGLILLIGIVILISTITDLIGWWRTWYTQFPDRIEDVGPNGLLGTIYAQIYLHEIVSVTYSQSSLGRIFGYRNITLHRRGKDQDYVLWRAPDNFGLWEYFKRIAAANNPHSEY